MKFFTYTGIRTYALTISVPTNHEVTYYTADYLVNEYILILFINKLQVWKTFS